MLTESLSGTHTNERYKTKARDSRLGTSNTRYMTSSTFVKQAPVIIYSKALVTKSTREVICLFERQFPVQTPRFIHKDMVVITIRGTLKPINIGRGRSLLSENVLRKKGGNG